MKKETINKILRETATGYDLISKKFSQTRRHFWRDLEFFGEYAQKDSKILDFGCGNGRLLDIFKDKNIDYVGVDVSGELINMARNNYAIGEKSDKIKFIKLNYDLNELPFPDNYFDSAYSVAVFHHLPGKEERLKKARELYRVIKPGGYILVTVWNLWSAKHISNICKNWINKLSFRSNLDWNDLWISFTDNDGKKFDRYHHAFTRYDLEKIFRKSGFKKEKFFKIGGNIVFIGRK